MGAKDDKWTDYLMRICNTVFHQSVAVIGTFILWVLFSNLPKNSEFTWHTILTATAYLPLMAEAIVLFANENVWTLGISRTTRYGIHGCILFCSAVFATVGIGLMINSKIVDNRFHFQSVHAVTGLISWILVLLSQCLGIASAKAQSLKNIARPVYFKFLHNIIGIFGFILGIVSLCFAFQKGTFREAASYEARLAATIVTGFIGCWTILAALKSALNQVNTIIGV